MRSIKIIALDPGGTTGWASYENEYVLKNAVNNKLELVLEPETGHFFCQQITGDNHHHVLYNILKTMFDSDINYLVSESFEYRNNSRSGLNLISCEYIGIARLISFQNYVPLIMQTASQGKVVDRKSPGLVKKENLEKLGLWDSKYKHSMDAYGHLLYFMLRNELFSKQVGHEKVVQDLLIRGWK